MSDFSEAEIEKRPRVARKRAVRATRAEPVARATRVMAEERPTRKRVPRKSVEASAVREEIQEVEERNERKAPTPIAARKASSKNRRNQLVVVGVLFILGVGASAAVGFTDDGRIDVNRAIEERNERIRNGQASADELDSIMIPVQNTEANQLPDGGLVGLGVGAEPPPPPPDPATTTASTTDETASSTDTGVEESEPSDETVGSIPLTAEEVGESIEEVETEPAPADETAVSG